MRRDTCDSKTACDDTVQAEITASADKPTTARTPATVPEIQWARKVYAAAAEK